MPFDFEALQNDAEKNAIYVVEQLLTQYNFDENDLKSQFDAIYNNPDILISNADDTFLLEHQKIMFDYIRVYKQHVNICSVPGVSADYTIEDILVDIYKYVVSDIMKRYYDKLFFFVYHDWE